MMLLSIIFGKLVQCVFCAPTDRPTSFNFATPLSPLVRQQTSKQRPTPHRPHSKSQPAQKSSSLQASFRVIQLFIRSRNTNSMTIVKDDWRLRRSLGETTAHPNFVRRDGSQARIHATPIPDCSNQSHREQAHPLQVHCLEGRSMVHMIERFLHVQLYYRNFFLPFSRQLCSLQQQKQTSICMRLRHKRSLHALVF